MSKTRIDEVVKQNEILLDTESKRLLATTHNCTTQSVRQSLKYLLNSEKAKAIRTSAKEILLQQANRI